MASLGAAEAGQAGSSPAGLKQAVASHVRVTPPPAPATWFDRRAAEAQAGSRRLTAIVLYALSFLVLVGLAVTVLVLSDNSSDEGKALGITTAGAVLVLDGITALGFQGGLFLETGTVLLVLAASRFLLLAAGTRLWLLGIALAYAAYGVFLAHKSASRYFSALIAQLHELTHTVGGTGDGRDSPPSGTPGSAVPPTTSGSVAPAAGSPQKQAGGNAAAPAPSPAAPSASDAPAEKPPTQKAKSAGMCGNSWVELVSSPLFLLVLLTVVFAGLIALLAWLQGEIDDLPSDEVLVLDTRHPQWTFGLGALVLVLACFGLFFLHSFLRHDRGRIVSIGTRITAFVFVVGCAGLGGLLFAATRSYIILGSLCFLPGAYVLFLALYGQLQADDYSVLLPGGFGWFPCCCAPNSVCGAAQTDEEDDAGASGGSSSNNDDVLDLGPQKEAGGGAKGGKPKSGGGAAAASASAASGDSSGGAAAASGAAKGPKSAGEKGSSGSNGDEKPTPDEEDTKKKFKEEGEAKKLQLPSFGEIAQQVQSCSLSSNQLRNTYMTLGTLLLFPGLLVCFASIVAIGLKPIRWAWYAAGMLLATATVFVAVRMYFGLLEVRMAQIVLYAIAVILHFACHVPIMVEYGQQNSDGVEGAGQNLLGVLFAFFLYPAMILSLVAAYKWSDEQWRLPPVFAEGVLFNVLACLRPRAQTSGTPAVAAAGSAQDSGPTDVTRSKSARRRDELKETQAKDKAQSATFVYACLLISQLVIIGFIAASNAVFDNVAVTAGVLVAYLFGLAVVCTVIYALAHNGYLPPAVSYAFASIVMLFVVAGVVVGAVLYVQDSELPVIVACLSASWWLMAILLVGYGGLSLLRAGAFRADPFRSPEESYGGGLADDGPLIFSPFVLPAYRHDLQVDELVEDNMPVITVMGGLAMGLTWGLAFAMVVSPAYLGVMAAVICTTLGVLLALHVVRRTESMVDEACELVDEEHARIVRKQQVRSAAVSGGSDSAGASSSKVSSQGSGSLRVLMKEAILQWSGALEASGESSSRGQAQRKPGDKRRVSSILSDAMNRSGHLDESASAAANVHGTADLETGPGGNGGSDSRAPVTLVEKLYNHATAEEQEGSASGGASGVPCSVDIMPSIALDAELIQLQAALADVYASVGIVNRALPCIDEILNDDGPDGSKATKDDASSVPVQSSDRSGDDKGQEGDKGGSASKPAAAPKASAKSPTEKAGKASDISVPKGTQSKLKKAIGLASLVVQHALGNQTSKQAGEGSAPGGGSRTDGDGKAAGKSLGGGAAAASHVGDAREEAHGDSSVAHPGAIDVRNPMRGAEPKKRRKSGWAQLSLLISAEDAAPMELSHIARVC